MGRGGQSKQRIFILGLSSDIGYDLACRYLEQGHEVIGTYRNKDFLKKAEGRERLILLPCNVADPRSIKACIARYGRQVNKPWDIFISGVGTMAPIGNFFDLDFDAWEASVRVNAMAQLRFLHGMYPYRRRKGTAQVIFFAGAGTNSTARNYSAYCIGKIALIKMCELIDDEAPGLNVSIIGPGWVRTKIHGQTLKARRAAGQNLKRTQAFLEDVAAGTAYQDIFDCISWCQAQGREVCGGRNFAVVNDPWRQGGTVLKEQLLASKDKFKLRRYKNQENV